MPAGLASPLHPTCTVQAPATAPLLTWAGCGWQGASHHRGWRMQRYRWQRSVVLVQAELPVGARLSSPELLSARQCSARWNLGPGRTHGGTGRWEAWPEAPDGPEAEGRALLRLESASSRRTPATSGAGQEHLEEGMGRRQRRWEPCPGLLASMAHSALRRSVSPGSSQGQAHWPRWGGAPAGFAWPARASLSSKILA